MPRRPNISRQTRAVVLAMSIRPRTWQYGYELAKQTGLTSGTLYPLLMRLSEHGLMEAKWQESEHPGRPPRHVYRLTPSGLAFARSMPDAHVPGFGHRRLKEVRS
jgi:PadR family transcriptional regulator PadR